MIIRLTKIKTYSDHKEFESFLVNPRHIICATADGDHTILQLTSSTPYHTNSISIKETLEYLEIIINETPIL